MSLLPNIDLKRLTTRETKEISNRQVFSLENNLSRGNYSLKDIGDIIPGAVMVHDMKGATVTYMNNWGCEALNHSMDEINAMGEEYYKKFFLPQESKRFMAGMIDYYQRRDHSALYTFFHRVRTGPNAEFSWYYAVCKFLRGNANDREPNKIILIANPLSGMGSMVNKVNRLLEENVFVANNYKKFALLTKREKEIINLLADGRSTSEISDILFISKHTVSTHRKNITNKLDITSFAELLKFAIAFDLIP